MSRRGRKRAPTDDAAHNARQMITQYIENKNISSAALARLARVSASSAWRVLRESPPRWSPTFSKLSEFVKLESEATKKTPGQPEALMRRLAQVAGRTGSPSAVTAALLRAVADLLDSSAARADGEPKR